VSLRFLFRNEIDVIDNCFRVIRVHEHQALTQLTPLCRDRLQTVPSYGKCSTSPCCPVRAISSSAPPLFCHL